MWVSRRLNPESERRPSEEGQFSPKYGERDRVNVERLAGSKVPGTLETFQGMLSSGFASNVYACFTISRQIEASEIVQGKTKIGVYPRCEACDMHHYNLNYNTLC